MNNEIDYCSILNELGYSLQDRGDEWRCRPIYRDSNNNTSLLIRKRDGSFNDFSAHYYGSFEDLIALTLNQSKENVKAYLQNKGLNLENLKKVKPRPKLMSEKIYPKEMLEKLLPHYNYWTARGVSEDTLRTFKGGLATGGKMYQRYVFPIFNENDQIIGFSGRSIKKVLDDSPKWKHIGMKANWSYPLYFNEQYIKEAKTVVLVESIGDMLSLWEADIKYTLVLFGVVLHKGILKKLIAINPLKIVIATNNDKDNNNVGNDAAKEIYKKLSNFFDAERLEIKLPTKNDFGDMNKEEIQLWKNQ